MGLLGKVVRFAGNQETDNESEQTQNRAEDFNDKNLHESKDDSQRFRIASTKP